MTSASGKNLDIEALRGYAIAITVVAHLGTIIPEWHRWLNFFWLGGGVDLFFCISGFLITTSLLELLEGKNSFWSYARVFWIRRIFRLWPAALFWSTLVLVISANFDLARIIGEHRLVVNSWLYGVLNLENFYIVVCTGTDPNCRGTPIWHYWSLALEEQFYFILPFVLYFTPRKQWLILLCLLLAIWQATNIRTWGTLLWFTRSDAILYGTAMALGWRYYSRMLRWALTSWPRWCYQSLVAVFALFLLVCARNDITPYYHGLVAATAGALVFIVSLNRNVITPGPGAKACAAYLGSRSYSLYLVHLPVFYLIRGLLGTDQPDLTWELFRILAGISGVAVALLCAEVSFRLIESPLRLFGRRLADNNSGNLVLT